MDDLCSLSGALGAGLAILTKWPIVATNMTPYSLTGEPTDVFGGDWFVGKGAGSVTIMHPILAQVQVFVTHVSSPTHTIPIILTVTQVLCQRWRRRS